MAALFATVTFTAAFTVPGGNQNGGGPDQGTAVLISNTAFKAFVIADTISMVLSLLACHYLHRCIIEHVEITV